MGSQLSKCGVCGRIFEGTTFKCDPCERAAERQKRRREEAVPPKPSCGYCVHNHVCDFRYTRSAANCNMYKAS